MSGETVTLEMVYRELEVLGLLEEFAEKALINVLPEEELKDELEE